jgi:hypothetical protein
MGLGAAGTAAVAAAGIGAAGSIGGSLIASQGQQAAAQTNQQALQTEQAMAQPFATMGQTTGNELTAELQSGALGQPAPTDLSAIAQMPGYQFSLQQGLLSTQNAAAARGLGVSGAALMGAANYATGLAQSNYQNYFNDYWANQNNRYNMLSQLTGLGANAAVGAGSNVANTAANVGSAQAASAGLTGSGVQGATNALTNSYMMNALLNSGTGATLSQSQNLANAQIPPANAAATGDWSLG